MLTKFVRAWYLRPNGFRPDYSLVPDWESSILFATRGCIRKCAFCAVPRLEGKTWGPAEGVRDLVHPDHRKVVLWDNNILGVSNWKDVVQELQHLQVEVDFNQGLDARLVTEEVAQELSKLRIRPLRMAYDIPRERKALERAIPALERRDSIAGGCTFIPSITLRILQRTSCIGSWTCSPGESSRTQCATSLSIPWSRTSTSLPIGQRSSWKQWQEPDELSALGEHSPLTGLCWRNFVMPTPSRKHSHSVPERGRGRNPPGIAGQIESPTTDLSRIRTDFRELLNDPATLLSDVRCGSCNKHVAAGESAFATQDYSGRYVGYICPECHPNRKWINGLWRSALGESFSLDMQRPEPLPVGLVSRTVH